MPYTFLVDGIRTPVGRFRGALAPVRTDDLAAHAIRRLLERHPHLPQDRIDDVIFGCANQAGEDNRNVARMAALLAGLPWSVPGETVNRLCASGMSATIHAHRAIQTGDGDLFITGGVEHMTRGPWVISKVSQPFGRDAQMEDSSFGWRFVNPKMAERYGTHAMGETAENLADHYQIDREAQDRFAYHSQMKTKAATDTGFFDGELTPVTIPQRKGDPIIVSRDEFPRPTTTLEKLATLRPAFRREGGTVTAGNASGLNDGAAALLVASDKLVGELQLQPLARIVSSGVSGVEPRIMGIGPVQASQRALDKAGLQMSDMDIIEINEAFAAQVLACLREWKIEPEDPRLNPNGGAISIGHPLGMTGARILLTAARELQRRNGRYALVCMCVGVGQGYATIIERVG